MTAIVAVAGTMISMPQMIGLANAQSEQGSTHACPQGFTLSRGRCTAPQPTTFQCIPSTVLGNQAILNFEFPTCIASCSGSCLLDSSGNGAGSAFLTACNAIPGSRSSFIPPLHIPGTPAFLCIFGATSVLGQCPADTTTSNGQCITKPGSRDQS